MTMTRQEAEAAGWRTGKLLDNEVVEWWAIFTAIDNYGDHRLIEYRISGPEQLTLQSITAIERYADAERMLEEVLDVAISASNTNSQIDRAGFIQDIIDMVKAHLEGRPYERT